MILRDHRDDGNAIGGVFYALPFGIAFWLVIAGAFVSPWLMLAGGVVFVAWLFLLLEGSSRE